RVLLRLNELARGNNALNMTLSTYVLTSLFEDVVEAANVRLQGMLEGRYSLRASETASDGRRKAGLDLMIHDAHTDSDRDVSSLSGGESFCVSLALALGLAEIVQANAGGIAIDTLFIDEGFGSLDGSRLNDVMNVLMGIKAHGRTVGLISHVESMKSQITEKITAVPDLSTGTSTLTVSWM
ncbi:MAG: SMC family ATPase, partial [Deltaproteobacteria bacterium]|nr:SMC family ATPase [Deltaproteobacteria bacterium]